MKTIEEILMVSKRDLQIQRIENLIRSSYGKLAFIPIHKSEELPLDKLIQELENSNYVIYIKNDDHIVLDLIESEEKQEGMIE